MKIWFGNFLKTWVLPISRPTSHDTWSLSQFPHCKILIPAPSLPHGEPRTETIKVKGLRVKEPVHGGVSERRTSFVGKAASTYALISPVSCHRRSLGVERSFSGEKREQRTKMKTQRYCGETFMCSVNNLLKLKLKTELLTSHSHSRVNFYPHCEIWVCSFNR